MRSTFPSPVRSVAFLGSHAPRLCGIATFTADLCTSVREFGPGIECSVVAINDVGKVYVYPPSVRFQITEENLGSYHHAAEVLNSSGAEVLSVQHEFGIYGGNAGAHLLPLLRRVRMPVVTTLHTILADPSSAQRAVMEEICRISEKVVVMAPNGPELLAETYRVPKEKIEHIHHGVSELPDSLSSKQKLNLSDHRVLLTFGLLSPDKGIEFVIDSLPEIVKKCPNVVYLVVGATHPRIREVNGEGYRLMLQARAEALGVAYQVRFCDRFVSSAELAQFLAAADVYVTPYLNEQQTTSGTLAYAVGGGKATVSSPYSYAVQMLAEGRGVIVPARDSRQIANAIVALLSDDEARLHLETRAAEFGKRMRWPVVAKAYVRCFEEAYRAHSLNATEKGRTMRSVEVEVALPEVNLAHLREMTDGTGLLQHAVYSVPRYGEGYCLDDNARALVLMVALEEMRSEPPLELRLLSTRYLAFVQHAFIERIGRFRNFMSYGRVFTEPCGSEDSHGRAIWALGTVGARSTDSGRRQMAAELFQSGLPAVASFTSPRAWSYALLGIAELVRAGRADEQAISLGKDLAERLMRLFRESSGDGWRWFESKATYSNGRVCQALIASGMWLPNDEMLETGLKSLEWLNEIQTTRDCIFAPIGSDGFFSRDGEKARFDQQPTEASGMIAACLLAYRATGAPKWRAAAVRAFRWFLGHNELGQSIYDPATGGCRDGLHEDRRNDNQGAESTLSFLMALVEMRRSDGAVDSYDARRSNGSSERRAVGG